MAKLTESQKELLRQAKLYCSVNNPIKYDTLKSLINIKSFDGSFNALYWRGYFAPVNTGDFSNQYILTKKANKIL